ncbi:hypothetical protein [Allosphingosinicella sp.]|jgi:hypothetical protein|uniref:hypothetical protein n=1 Tax=Allosphingosinicella sp. TaxID=2823234 RepID=UPI002EFDEEDA
MLSARIAILLCASAAGCVHQPLGPDPMATRQAIDRAAAQVQACYRGPRVPFEARQIVTRLLVRFSIEGEPVGPPLVVRQESLTPNNRAYAATMARAAMEAVMRCAPFRLPPKLHSGGWEEFELTFSRRGVA